MPLNDSYESIYERANKLASERQWEQASGEYERIFDRLGKLGPDTRGKHPGFADIFTRTSIELIALLIRMEEYDRAIAIMQRAMAYDPASVALWRRETARCRIRQGKTEEGLSELQAVAAERPDPYSALALGEAYLTLQDYDRATAQLTETARMAESMQAFDVLTLAYRYLFDIHASAGDVANAIRTWEMAGGFDEATGIDAKAVYELFLQHGDTDGARALMMSDPDPLRKGLYRGLVNLHEGDGDAARQQWERVVQRDIDVNKDDIGCWAEAGLRAGGAKRVVEKLAPVLLSSARSDLHASVLLAIALAALGETQQANVILQTIRDTAAWTQDDRFGIRYWQLLDESADDAVKAALRYHFVDVDAPADGSSVDDVAADAVASAPVDEATPVTEV